MIGKLGFLSFHNATTPRDGEVMIGRWWTVHPEYGLAFYQRPGMRGWSPQCNSKERIARSIAKSCYPRTVLIVKHVPIAYVGRFDNEWGNMPEVEYITEVADLTVEVKL